MEEQIINFETAKLAKEKGFDEECDYNYCLETYRFPTELNAIKGNVYKFRLGVIRNACAPTKSLLQKWIRERHSIHIEIKPIPFGEDGFKWIYEFGLMGISSLDNVSRRNTYSILVSKERVYFDDYEEALDDGLFEALKLIKA